MDPYHIIHVKDDRFIGHGLNLSWKGKRPPPSTFYGCQDLHTPLKSQGHTVDRRSSWQASAGGMEAAHSPAGRIVLCRVAGEAMRARKMFQRNRTTGAEPDVTEPSWQVRSRKRETQIPAGQSEVQRRTRPISRLQKYPLRGDRCGQEVYLRN